MANGNDNSMKKLELNYELIIKKDVFFHKNLLTIFFPVYFSRQGISV